MLLGWIDWILKSFDVFLLLFFLSLEIDVFCLLFAVILRFFFWWDRDSDKLDFIGNFLSSVCSAGNFF